MATVTGQVTGHRVCDGKIGESILELLSIRDFYRITRQPVTTRHQGGKER